MEAKYPRLRSEKIMTAYLGYEVDVLKTKQKMKDCCRVSTINSSRSILKGWPEKSPGLKKYPIELNILGWTNFGARVTSPRLVFFFLFIVC